MSKQFKAKNREGTVYFPCRLSYANLFEPRGFSGQEPKFSTACLIDKDDEHTLAVLKAAIKDAVETGKERKWGGKVPKNLRLPLRDGDEERPDDENYAGMIFMNANAAAKHPPKLMTRVKGEEATEEDLYSGCYAVVVVNFFPYATSGNNGIGAGLVAVQHLSDGDRLAGSSMNEAELEFDEDDDDDFDFLG